MTGKEISVYFHIPFCTRKCPYCHFYVLPDKESLKEQLAYSLEKEYRLYEKILESHKIISVYFGGGTPFLFGPKRLSYILSLIRTEKDCEITLEVNPEHVSFEAITAYKNAGVNRISLGVQALENRSLINLGRSHSAQQAIEAIHIINKAGISNISLDLMYDLPHQRIADWEESLNNLKGLPITHLSLYNLTIEPHTTFFKYRTKLYPHLPSSEESLEMLSKAIEYLNTLGLNRYEISAFSKPGFESIHNSGYWTGRPFLGFGPSAFSFWMGKRYRNIAHLNRYSKMLDSQLKPIDFEEQLNYPNNLNELLAIGLRLCNGVNLIEFQAKFGHLHETTLYQIELLLEKGFLIKNKEERICLSDQGLLFYDTVAQEII